MNNRNVGKWLVIFSLIWLVAYVVLESEWIMYGYVVFLLMGLGKVYLNYRHAKRIRKADEKTS